MNTLALLRSLVNRRFHADTALLLATLVLLSVASGACNKGTARAKVENTVDLCRDSQDNDGDGFTDCADQECHWFCEDAGEDGGIVDDGVERYDAADHAEQSELPDQQADPGDAADATEQEVAPSCGDGVVDTGEECDDGRDGDPDDGCRDDCTFSCHVSADCDDGHACTTDVCGTATTHACSHALASGVVCRAAAGVCDVSETCDGTSAACPSDAFVATIVVCRADAGYCDARETCAGTAAACPSDTGLACGAGKRCDRDFCVDDGFALVPAGTFTMGSPAGEAGRHSDETQHTVTLTVSFEMMAREVTQGEFQARVGRNPSSFTSCGSSCPVEQVSWHEALDYANLFSAYMGAAQCFDCTGSGTTGVTCSLKAAYAKPQDCPGFRLPTEAEWEYAARAGTTSAYHDGGASDGGHSNCETPFHLTDIAWYCGNASSTTHAVGGKTANPWGLFDMSGNVWEWVWDWYGTYPGTVSDYFGPGTGSNRVLRGGGWGGYAIFCRSADRFFSSPGNRNYSIGLRLARSL